MKILIITYLDKDHKERYIRSSGGFFYSYVGLYLAAEKRLKEEEPDAFIIKTQRV